MVAMKPHSTDQTHAVNTHASPPPIIDPDQPDPFYLKPHQLGGLLDVVEEEDEQVIIPGLPRSLAYKCLARVPRESQFSLIRVCKAWRKALVSGEVYRLRKEMSLVEPWIFLAFSPNAKNVSKLQQEQQPAAACSSMSWLEAYDPRANLWHRLGSIPGLPDRHTLKDFAFVALGDKLYVVGGRLSTCISMSTAACHSGDGPQSHANSSSCRTNSNEGMQEFQQQQEVIRKEVLAFDCTTREWSECASMSTPRVNFACTVCRGRIYVAGGRSTAGQEKGVSSAEVYIPEADCWVALPGCMSTGRYKCVGVTLSEERIHVVGGFAGPEESDQLIQPFNIDRSCVDVFHPPSGQWTLLKGMWQLDIPPNQIVTLQGRLYSSGDALNTWKGRIEEYDTALNMWKIVEGSWLPMTHPEECHNSERCYLTMAPIGHRLYFLGGYRLPSDHSYTALHTVYIFDTIALDAASRWQLVEPMQDTCKELCSHCCVVSL